MADQNQLEILRKGADVWNQWREENIVIRPNLTDADLSNVDLEGANLTGANLTDANLTGANLIDANLTGANLTGVNLNHAHLIGANLEGANLTGVNLNRANLEGTYLTGAHLTGAHLTDTKNLTSAHLTDTDLNGANLTGLNFSDVSFIGKSLIDVNLTDTLLIRFQALGTNFKGAILTGACIEDWNINSQTNLQDVKCDYIYLKYTFSEEEKKWIKSDRRPHNRNFKEGEFAQLFQKALETVDLIFSEGIEWTAFLESFQQLQAEVKSEELGIQGIEKKSGGAFVVRLEVPRDANKAEIENYIRQEYEAKVKVIEVNYQRQLEGKDETIQAYREQSTNMFKVVEMLSNSQQQINVNFSPNIYNQNGKFGIGHNDNSSISDNTKVAGEIDEAGQEDKL